MVLIHNSRSKILVWVKNQEVRAARNNRVSSYRSCKLNFRGTKNMRHATLVLKHTLSFMDHDRTAFHLLIFLRGRSHYSMSNMCLENKFANYYAQVSRSQYHLVVTNTLSFVRDDLELLLKRVARSKPLWLAYDSFTSATKHTIRGFNYGRLEFQCHESGRTLEMIHTRH
ncbi:hypothetical protein KCU66_g16, partial [Aureobasidium melanogenum]